ncbi:MAG: hypothetical protein N2234_06505, partial [Planctomycetota bacterium]|nr:hypothetical protein [Planctomycetota bacterium]
MLRRVFLFCSVLVCAFALGDVVELLDGGRLVGKVIEENDDEVVILTVKGIVARVPRERTSKIERGSPEELYRKQMEELDKNDVEMVYAFA